MVAQGALLAGVAEVSLQLDGGDHDDRLVLLRGDLTDVQYGAQQQLVQATVADPKDTSDLLLPPAHQGAPRRAAGQRGGQGAGRGADCPPIKAGSAAPAPARPPWCCAMAPAPWICTLTAWPTPSGNACTRGRSCTRWTTGASLTAVEFQGGTGVFNGTGGPVYASLRDSPTNGHPVQVARLLVEQFNTLGELGAIAYLYALAEARTGYLLAEVVANAQRGAHAGGLYRK